MKRSVATKTTDSMSTASLSASASSSYQQCNQRASGYYAAGREFYDDMYDADGLGSDGEASIPETLDFSEPLEDLRRDELQALHQAYQELATAKAKTSSTKRQNGKHHKTTNKNSSQAPPICILKGLSGTGKSTLFHHFCSQLLSQSPSSSEPAPRVLQGKFEELSGENPLSALLEAMAGMARTDTPKELQETRQKLIVSLGGRQAVSDLGTMIPALQPLLQAKSVPTFTKSTTATHNDLDSEMSCGFLDDKSQPTLSTGDICIPTKTGNENAWNQLKFRLKALMQAICSSSRPTILFLDDLQWMDSGTVELLEVFLLDRSEAFLLVGSYRADHTLPDAFWKLLTNCAEQGSNITTIEVENLTLPGMVTFLTKTLGMDIEDDESERERLDELAKILQEKTQGNLFFARQVLEELATKGWLSFSRMTFSWEWDLDRIQVSDNVLEAVSRRIRTDCSPTLQRILITAAYMRSTVDADSLMLAVDWDKTLEMEKQQQNHKDNDTGNGSSDQFKPLKQRLIEELDKAVKSGFLTNMIGSNIYTFAHDRIKQAAYDMVEEGPDRDKFRRSIANRLYRISKDRRLGRDWMVYSAADHFNATPLADNLFLAKVNLEAGRRSMAVASFKTTSKYLGYAVEHLKGTKDAWAYHYNMSLEIYTKKAEVELLLGNLEEGRRVSRIVFENAKSEDDKLHPQMELAKALGRKESHVESLQLTRKTLQSLKLYRKTKAGMVVTLLRDLMFIRRYLKRNSDEEILDSPITTDPKLRTIFELFVVNTYQAWFAGNVLEFLVSTCRSLRLSITNGMCGPAMIGFSGYAMFNDGIGNGETASRCLNVCLALLKKSGERDQLCLQLVIKALFLDGWKPDPTSVYDYLHQSHKIGLEVGDFENAFMALGFLLEHKYSHGCSLALLDVQFAELVEKEKVYGVGSFQATTDGFWDPIRYLRGTADNLPLSPLKLPFDRAAKLDLSAYDNEAVAKIFHFRGILQIGVYWNDVQFLEKLLENVVPQQDKTHNQSAIRLCFLALAYGTVYQQGDRKKKSYLKKGRRCAQELKSLCESKGKNSWHRYLLASTHLKVTSYKANTLPMDVVIQQYEFVMDTALKTHHKQDVALAAQLLVDQIIWREKSPDKELLTKYLMMARRMYKGWGATNLVRHLDEKYSGFLEEVLSDGMSAPTSYKSHNNSSGHSGRQIAAAGSIISYGASENGVGNVAKGDSSLQ